MLFRTSTDTLSCQKVPSRPPLGQLHQRQAAHLGDRGRRRSLARCWWGVSGAAAWEEVWGFLKRQNRHHATQQPHFWVYARESGTRVHVNTCAQVHDGSTHGSRKGNTAQRPTDRRADRESGPGPTARGPGPPRATWAGRAAKTRQGRGSGAWAGTAQRRAPQGECAEAESGSAASGGGGGGRVLKSRVPPGL